MPNFLRVRPNGDIFFKDISTTTINCITTNGSIFAVAGVAFKRGYQGDGGQATSAWFSYLNGFDFSPDGSLLYIADGSVIGGNGYGIIRRVDLTSGIISTWAGSAVNCTIILSQLPDVASTRLVGPPTRVCMNPQSVAVNTTSGDIFVFDYSDQVLYRIDGSRSTMWYLAGGGNSDL